MRHVMRLTTQSALTGSGQLASSQTSLLTTYLIRHPYARIAEWASSTDRLRQRRLAHSHTNPIAKRHVSSTVPTTDIKTDMTSNKPIASAALSCLPLSVLLRSYLVTVISSTPFLLTPSLKILSLLAHSNSAALDPDRNPVLRAIIKHTMYKQFCAGTNPTEVRASVDQLKRMGYSGAILGYAREVVMDESEVASMDKAGCTDEEALKERQDVAAWELGTIRTVELAEPGDFVALKFTGAGHKALTHLMKNCAPTQVLEEAIVNICEKAKDSGVRLLFDAEQAALQDGIDAWTVEFMQRYNRPSNPDGGRALIYGTYQAYRTSTPGTIAKHMELAKQGSWRLGIKLVRGAYLGSDPRHLFWATKEETDKAYNGIAKSLMQGSYSEVLKPAEGSDGVFRPVDLVLAGHNSRSVNMALAVRDEQTVKGQKKIEMVYGQLMGMADHVSCALVQKARMIREAEEEGHISGDEPKTFKYIVWGTVGECTKYLLRRAQENRDAVERTVEGRKALGKELARRMRLSRS